MKHPALVRVFAIVLAIMSVISCAAGAVGFSDAKKERADGVSYGDKLDKRLETYRQLKAELDGSISYEEAMAELEKLQEQHDSDASQHRTDLATYSASRGGYKMGADALWEAKAQIAGAKQMIAQAKAKITEMENAKAMMQGAIAQCDAAAAECAASLASLNGVMAVINAQPQMPTMPEMPEGVHECQPPATVVPDPGEPPAEPVRENYSDEETYNQACAAYQEELAAYNAAKAAYDQYLKEVEDFKAYSDYLALLGNYETEMGEYGQQMQSWQAELMTAIAGVDTAACQAALQNGMAVLQGIQGMIPGGAGMFSAEPGVGADPGAGADPTESIKQLYDGLAAVSYGLGAASGGLRQAITEMENAVTAGLSQMGGMSGMDLPEGLSPSQMIAYAEEQIAKGEFEIQKNLENIWYELGELEKDKKKLEEDKSLLDEEASKLGKMIVSTDELEELNSKFKSAKAVLTNIGEIKTAVDAGESIEDAAAGYSARYRAQTQTRFETRRAICILAVAAGVMGLAVMPAAFEKSKKRVWLILPAVLCLVCAVAAEIICVASNLGQHYASIFTAVFAVLYLLAALPKNKTGTAAK